MTAEFVHVVCPQCDAVNRFPFSRLNAQPKCGQCHHVLFNGQPLELIDSNFARHIERSEIPVIVDFWAPWCGPCKAMGPAFAEAAQRLEPRVRLAKLNTETQQVTASRYAIRSIPTLIMFYQGREMARQAGAMTVADIVRWVESRI